MVKKLILIGISSFSVSVFGLPATSDVLIKGLLSSKCLEQVFQQLGSTDHENNIEVFDTVKISRITPTQEIRELCKKQGGYGKSAGFLDLTVSKDEKSESFIFATSFAPEDLALCE